MCRPSSVMLSPPTSGTLMSIANWPRATPCSTPDRVQGSMCMPSCATGTTDRDSSTSTGDSGATATDGSGFRRSTCRNGAPTAAPTWGDILSTNAPSSAYNRLPTTSSSSTTRSPTGSSATRYGSPPSLPCPTTPRWASTMSLCITASTARRPHAPDSYGAWGFIKMASACSVYLSPAAISPPPPRSIHLSSLMAISRILKTVSTASCC